MTISRRTMNGLAAYALASLMAWGCDGASIDDDPADGAAAREDAQVAQGAALFAENCAKCHGADGHGTNKAPALVGAHALARFATAQDVFDFASKNMPKDRPGSLKKDQYWAILAFALHANGIQLHKKLGPGNAHSIKLH